MNKRKNIINSIITVIGGSLMASCASEAPEKTANNDNNSDTSELVVKVLGVESPTRSIIEGTQLPNDSEFSLFAYSGESVMEGGENAKVTFSNGNCMLYNPVGLPAYTEVSVYAFYPYNESQSVNSCNVDATMGIDYLSGECVGEGGELTMLQAPGNITANLLFKHVMARITLRFQRKDTNEETYEINSVSIGGDSNDSFRKGSYDLVSKGFYNCSYDEYQSIKGSMLGTVLDDNNKVVEADFLVIPSTTAWLIELDSNLVTKSYTIPEYEYVSGKQYVYNVIIDKDKILNLSQCEIVEWEQENMHDLNLNE